MTDNRNGTRLIQSESGDWFRVKLTDYPEVRRAFDECRDEEMLVAGKAVYVPDVENEAVDE